MATKTICGCGHPISEHTYSEDFTGCDQSICKCSLDLGAYIDNLNAELATAKARAKTAEENWHKNEARLGRDGLIFMECMKLLGLDVSGTDPEAIPAAIKRLKGVA